MVIKDETIKRTIVNYVDDVKNTMQIDRVFLFGSYAKGNADKDSDIDICFFSNSFENKNSMDVVKLLFRMTRKYGNYDIQPTAFTMSDIENDNPLVKEILRTGIEL